MKALHRTLVILVLAAIAAETHGQYPTTYKSDTTDVYHGQRVRDPYRWLETVEDPKVHEWVAAQDAFAEPRLQGYRLREWFLNRIESIETTTESQRIRRQWGRWIIARTSADGSTDFFVQNMLNDEPRLLFSPGERFPDRREVVQDVYLSPNGTTLAYTSSSGGSTSLTLRFYDLDRQIDLVDVIENTKWGHPQWTADGRSILYQRLIKPGHTQPDGIDRESAIWRHTIGSEASEDDTVYRVNPDDLGAGSTVSVPWPGRFVFIADHYSLGNSVAVIDLGDPHQPEFGGPTVPITNGRAGSNTVIGVVGTTAYLLTTDGAPKGKVVAVDLDDPSVRRTVIPESQHLLERAKIAGDRICVGYMRDVATELRLFDLNGTHLADVPMPTRGSAFWFSGDPSSDVLSFAFDSFVYSQMTYLLSTQTLEVMPAQAGSAAVDPQGFVTEQAFFISRDGTRVPMFIVSRADRGDGPFPTMLYGYGAAGGVFGPIFTPEWVAWIEAGGVFALANVRGGGEYGREWYRAGCLENKQNTYDDFIAAAEHLIARGYTTSNQLAIHGMSNGGMLVGAVVTQRPELFAAAVPVAGVLDALRFPSFTAGPRWASDMGDPTIPEQFEWLYSWSPLHRIEDGTCYPATLITTAANDDVVHPSQSYKFAARMQEAQGCDAPILLRVYGTGAHRVDQHSPDQRQQAADRLAFIAHHTGLAEVADSEDEDQE